MYLCAKCRQKEGITECSTCGAISCEFCEWDEEENNKPHDQEIHGPVYDYADYLDAMYKRNIESVM